MLKVTISEKGQISIPASLRKRFGLEKGDKLVVEEIEGTIVLRPIPEHPILSLRGKYKSKGKETLTTLLLKERQLDRKREQ
jgi:AbrB family looped-hinge helix DNA binding protein